MTITVSDAQFRAWLDSPRSRHCILVEADWEGVTDEAVGPGVNVASVDQGATAGASSVQGPGYDPRFTINGNPAGAGWSSTGGWNDATSNAFPDWLRVDFAGQRLIDRVVVYSVQDNFGAPAAPTDDMTGTLYVLRDFEVQMWTGARWQTLASVLANSLIKRTVTFVPVVTSAIRIYITATADTTWSRITAVEAWTPAAASGVECMATEPFVSRPTDTPANQRYASRIVEIPEFVQKMGELFVARTTANLGEIKVASVDAGTDAWLFGRDWIGNGVRLYVGDAAWGRDDFRNVWTGVIGDVRVEGTNRLVFEARDMQHLLNQPLKREAIESGNMAGQPAPIAIGTVYNAPCVPIDESARLFRLADGPIASIIQVRNNGSNFTTYTANLADGTITLTSGSAQGLTADFVGPTVGSLTLTNASDLIRHLVTTRGYLADADLDIESFVRLRELVTAPLALYVPAVDQQVYQAVDEVLTTIGGYSAITRAGKYYVGRLDMDGEPLLEIAPAQILDGGLTLAKVFQPVDTIRLGARQNNTTHLAPTSSIFEGDHVKYRQPFLQMGQANNARTTVRKFGRMPAPAVPVVNNVPDPGLVPTLFLNGADAAMEAERRMSIWGARRYLFSVECFVSALLIDIGTTVRLYHPRFNLAGGRNGVVVSLRERLSARRVQLGVLV
jgi:hypothetical protein